MLLTVILTVQVGSCDEQLKLPYPNTLAEGIQTNHYFCKALMGSSLVADSGRIISKGRGVLGKLFEGTDEMSIQIKGDKLHFLTRASFESGLTEDDSPFEIIVNNDKELTAIDIDEGVGTFVNVFTLNKETNIAVWSKVRSRQILTQDPDVQSYVLECLPQ